MGKIKILQINSVYKIASTGRTCYELCSFLESTNEFIVKTVCKNSKIDSDHTIQIGNFIDYKLHSLLSRIFGLPGYFSAFQTKKVIKVIKKYKPDIIHLRNLHSSYINIPILLNFIFKKNIATVVTLHDSFLFTGKCTNPDTINCEKYKHVCKKCPLLKEGNKSWFFDFTKKMQKSKKKFFEKIASNLAVVGVSQWITNASIGSLLDCASIRTTIYNWIDTKTFYPRKNLSIKVSSLPIILGIASHWEKSKGYKDFIFIAKYFVGKAQIFLVGDVKEDEKIKEIVYYGTEKDINKLAEIYSLSTVLFNPTKTETFGKVSAEALACGTPVVAYDIAANKEIIGDGCGYLVLPNNISDVINKLNIILEKGKEFYSEVCVNYVRKKFSLTINSNKYAELYKKLLNRGESNEERKDNTNYS